MRIPLAAVGSTPPRSRRGRTLLPERAFTVHAVWAGRVFWTLLLLVISPVGPLVAGWWLWGNRWRMWRWYVGVCGTLLGLGAVVVAGRLGHPVGLAGLHLWQHVAGASGKGPTGWAHQPIDVLGLAVAGWVTGTIAGCWMSFLAWVHTPVWRDRARPMTWTARRRQRALVTALAAGAGDVPGVATFGYDVDTGNPVELPWEDTAGHVLIVGSPGSGKTTTSLKLVRAAIRDQMFTAVLDMKGSPTLVEQIADWCARFNRPLWVFTADGPSRYDPFRAGDYNRKRDLLMATGSWPDPYYQAKAADYLLAVFYALEITGVSDKSWLHTVSELLNPATLARFAAALPASDPRTLEARARIARVVDEAANDNRALSGVAPRVRALTDTVLGAWLQPGEPSIDLEAIWEQGGVVVFSLPSLTYPEASVAFGGLVAQDLKTLAGTLQAAGNKNPGLVFVDEFATLGPQNVTSALAMSRESGLRWALATQDLGDLAIGGTDGRAFVQKILTDTNIKIIHSVGDPQTAQRLAELAGWKWGVKERSAVNQADSALDYTRSTLAGAGYVDQLLVPVIEANDILQQGSAAAGTFTLIDKPGMFAISGARTVPDQSTVDRSTATVPLWLPGSAPVPVMHPVLDPIPAVTDPAPDQGAPVAPPAPRVVPVAAPVRADPDDASWTAKSSPLTSGLDDDPELGFWA